MVWEDFTQQLKVCHFVKAAMKPASVRLKGLHLLVGVLKLKALHKFQFVCHVIS